MRIAIISTFLGLCLLAPLYAFSEGDGMSIPNNFEEIKALGKSMLRSFPNAFKKAGQEGWGIIKWIWSHIEAFLIKHVEPVVSKAINWLKGLVGKEVEQRKPEVKEEFKRETEQIKEKVPTGKGLWERFKSLFF